MQSIRKRGLFTLGCLFALFMATGCFQAAGDTLQATGIAQGVATFTPMATATIEEEDTATPEADEQTGEATPTPDSAASVLEQEEQPGDLQAQDIDPLNLTSTAIIERATADAAARLTATAEAEITQFVPTATPTLPVAVPTATPIQQQPPIVSGADCVHIVQASDRNLWRISLLYGITVHDIAAASGISNIQLIVVGQRLTIPGCGTTGYRQPQVPDQGGGSVPPGGSGQVHVVRQNETLFRIALQYGVSLSQLAAINGIANPNLIYIDQRLVIP